MSVGLFERRPKCSCFARISVVHFESIAPPITAHFQYASDDGNHRMTNTSTKTNFVDTAEKMDPSKLLR